MEGAEVPKMPTASWEGAEVDLASIIGHKRTITLNSCESCRSEEAKYRCPRCMKYSCSLPCVKKHKRELGCSGVRDKAAYVATSQFTDLHLLSDYRFLEDVGRSAENAVRDVDSHVRLTTRSIEFMKNQARQNKVHLITLPIGFTKRKQNSTYFDRSYRKFFWCVKLLFPQSQAEYFERRVPEDLTLHKILKRYIDPTESDPVIRQRLKAYVWAQSGVTVFMKVERRKRDSVRYFELDCSKSLFENLKNKTIIEYPTFYVTLKEFRKDFVVLGQENYTLSKPCVPSSMQCRREDKEGGIHDST